MATGSLRYLGSTLSTAYWTCGYCTNDTNGRPVVYAFTDDMGLAAVEPTLGTVAPEQTVYATVEIPKQRHPDFPTVTWAGRAGWTITVPPGPTTAITATSGDVGIGPAGATLPDGLVVQTLD